MRWPPVGIGVVPQNGAGKAWPSGHAGLPLAAAILLSGCLAGGSLVGQPAPTFEFVASDGTYVNETTHLGQWVILDLMATWCGPCRLEVAHLREVQARHGDEVAIFSIGVDRGESMQDLDRFGEEYGATWPYALDRSGEIKTAMEMRIIPKLVIIDPQGVVAFERQGEVLPAAITRIIDPSAVPSPIVPLAVALAGLGLGFLAALNPYRRAHRGGEGGGPSLAALGVFGALALLAWPLSGLASTRATYGSLIVGALTLASALWWLRARHRIKPQARGTPLQRGGDRVYEMAPHFAGALVLALTSFGASGFYAPLFGFLVGAMAGLATRLRIPERPREALGLMGLVLVGAGLLAFGARILAP